MSGTTASLPEQNDSGERERLGRFSLLRVIGRGASAVVYEALDTRMERPVALKVLSFDPLLSPEQRHRQVERFEREARAVARLSHPNIVSVYDVGEEDGKHFQVMELLSGVTLRERIDQDGPIALREATSIVEQIASALDCTHAEGIVHRDIKPSNVLLMPDGRVKMLDFGIARRGEDATVTHMGMLIGSPAYMSPEQGRGENATPSSDIWSLGALLYEMLTGISPFGAANVASVLYKAAHDKPEPLPDDSAQAQKVIDHALAKNPEERYASAGAMAAALRAAVDFHVDSLSMPSPPHSQESAGYKSLQNAAATAFVPSSARSTLDEPAAASTSDVTAGRMTRPRSRMGDYAVLAAWCAVAAGALGIVTIRLGQSNLPNPPSTASTPSPAAVPMVGAVTISSPSPMVSGSVTEKTIPSSTPSVTPSSAAVQITERAPSPLAASTPAAVRPSAKPAAASYDDPEPAKVVPSMTTVSSSNRSSQPKATKSPAPPAPTKNNVKPADNSAEPPWDARIDRLGEPEPEPTPEKSPTPAPPPQRQEEMENSTPEKGRFQPSVLLGIWKGNVWKRGATLNVQSSDNDSFQGTLTLQAENGPVRFAVQGSFSPITGRVSFWSADAPSGTGSTSVNLGQGNGRLISAKTMGGLIVDSDRKVFTWSFSR